MNDGDRMDDPNRAEKPGVGGVGATDDEGNGRTGDDGSFAWPEEDDGAFALHDEEGVEPTEVERVGRDLIRVPMVSPTLPPATRTNAWLVRSDGGWLLVDPAVETRDAIERLNGAVARWVGDWSRVVGALLTHEHVDHVGGLGWWQRTHGRPVWAHPATIERLRGPDGVAWRTIDDDEGPYGLPVAWTPGHAAGHVILKTREEDLVAGDLIAGIGTILVEPEGGGMTAYLRSLGRAIAWDPARVFPSHGPASTDGVARLEAYVAHRLRREQRVVRALSEVESRGVHEVTARAYAELSPTLWPLAWGSALAHLERLVELGEARVEEAAEGEVKWRRTERPRVGFVA
jgi:ribonuclease/clavin/mitogillin